MNPTRCYPGRTQCRPTVPSAATSSRHPWRPAHIHFKVEAGGHQRLVTQLFFADDTYLDDDTIGAVKPALVRPVTRHHEERERARRDLDTPFCTCAFDIRLRAAARA